MNAVQPAGRGDQARVEPLLRLGDDALILGQRLCEWCGHAPVLEEDIALANVALDLLGQARLWLSAAGEAEGAGRGEDELAFLRREHEFRNLLLVEQPNGDFAFTMARQFFFDAWHHLQLETLAREGNEAVRAIAAKALKEVAYHVRRSGEWVVRLGDGTVESHARMQRAVDELWIFTGEPFEADAVTDAARGAGTGTDPSVLREPWLRYVTATLREATLVVPEVQPFRSGGRRGVHSEHLGYLLAEMQVLQRTYPGCRW